MACDPYPMFKLVLLGEPGVGKTTLFFRTKDNMYMEKARHTIGIDSCTRVIQTQTKKIKFCLWDTAGVERFRTLTRNYYRNTQVVLLVYSVDDPNSLSYLAKWANDATDFAPSALRFLVGNKTDLRNEVDDNAVKNFCQVHDCDSAYYISSKTGEGVEDAMKMMGERLLQNYSQIESQTQSWLDTADMQKPQISRKGCCS